jgi:hypothetical protein
MSKSRSKFKAVPKKKKERDVSNVPNQKKKGNPRKKINPPTHLAMSKSS